MSQLLHEFLEDDERGRTIIAGIGIAGGVALLAVGIFARLALR